MSIKLNSSPVKGLATCLVFLCLVFFCGSGCRKKESLELYHKFPDKIWARFNILSFEIPVKQVDKPYNIYLFTRFTKEFSHEQLEFNMVMNTAAGEERIYAYAMKVKSASGAFLQAFEGDSCTGTILLKHDLKLARPGILKIEIENLTPRLTTEGVMGVGIRMEQSGK